MSFLRAPGGNGRSCGRSGLLRRAMYPIGGGHFFVSASGVLKNGTFPVIMPLKHIFQSIHMELARFSSWP